MKWCFCLIYFFFWLDPKEKGSKKKSSRLNLLHYSYLGFAKGAETRFAQTVAPFDATLRLLILRFANEAGCHAETGVKLIEIV